TGTVLAGQGVARDGDRDDQRDTRDGGLSHGVSVSTSTAIRNPTDGERLSPAPISSSLTEHSGGWGPPSRYQSEPAARYAQPPLRRATGVARWVSSLPAQSHPGGPRRCSRPAWAATCHSSSVGSRAPAHAA